MKYINILFVTMFAIMLAACSSSSAPVTANQEGTIQREKDKQRQMGVVTQVKKVSIMGRPTNIGSSAGRTVGRIAGGATGSGYGSVAGSIAGAFIGGIIGSNADKGLQKKPGLEITVRLSNAELVTITQRADVAFKVGDAVRLEMLEGKARVVHRDSND